MKKLVGIIHQLKNNKLNRLNFIKDCNSLTLEQRAAKMYEVIYVISSLTQKNEWVHLDRTSFQINEKDTFIEKLLREFKKDIRRYTIIKDIANDFIDESSSIYTVFASIKQDDDLAIMQIVSATDHELIIKNCDKLNSFFEGGSLKEFIGNLTKKTGFELIDLP